MSNTNQSRKSLDDQMIEAQERADRKTSGTSGGTLARKKNQTAGDALAEASYRDNIELYEFDEPPKGYVDADALKDLLSDPEIAILVIELIGLDPSANCADPVRGFFDNCHRNDSENFKNGKFRLMLRRIE